MRLLVEGPNEETVRPIVEQVNRLVALGVLGHLPVGGHKTRGAGWLRWEATDWRHDDVVATRTWSPPRSARAPEPAQRISSGLPDAPGEEAAWVRRRAGRADEGELMLGAATELAQSVAAGRPLVAWWCEPTIDLALHEAPATFGRTWPRDAELRVDEVAFFLAGATWRGARTSTGTRWILIEEVETGTDGASEARVRHVPARLHGNGRRFCAAAETGGGCVILREWYVGDELLGYTLTDGGF